ncbi:MAG: NAD-dependent DNA ligase LigA [Spirochaetaceae bacterium]|jgi:DNA ligase (NAD+)|nr:NAD-dependent DNA ligase LigA [Spirochaetaceae bacterium]
MAANTERIKALERLIKKYQDSYYNGEAEISDAEFDLLWDELKSLDPQSPVLARVGADGLESGAGTGDGFPKTRHLIPMGSQEKAANPEDFRGWAEKISAREDFGGFLVQYKLDGASLELQYERGKLKKAVTRGDGTIGDEITPNARRMRGVAGVLAAADFSGGIRGEVVMTREVWRDKYRDKANCRNAANGLMRRKDGAGSGDLSFIAYDASALKGGGFPDEAGKIAWLEEQGFGVTDSRDFSGGDMTGMIEEIVAYREGVAKIRDTLPFDIDGLVVKDKTIDPADLRRARPERQIAFKFEPETAFSILRAVEWSESGATYTPIAVIDPVRLAGTTVQRANLNNPDMIRAMGLKTGSAVSVVKRGEIIPKIEGLAPEGALETGDLAEIELPGVCGSCNTPLKDEGTRLFCPNPGCPKRLHHRLEKWVSVLDIRELGDKLIRQLFDSGRVRNISDLYTLTAEELAALERMGEASAAKVIRHIRTPRELSLQVFIAGLDLEGVGELIMERAVSAGYNTLEKIGAATAEELAAVWGIGSITAKTIVEGTAGLEDEIRRILAAGAVTIAPPPREEEQPLRGQSFCFTGELRTMKRSEAEEKVKALGGSAKSSVVKDLSYLVTNDTGSGSAKNKKARDLGIPIITEDEFLALTGRFPAPP